LTRIPDDVLETIRQAVDLAELVGRYVPLKRAGKSWKGRCPFHQEKTPSFTVTPERGMWKCFGCGKGGNAFTFLMEREGVTFPEAARQLAREVGVALPEDDDPAASAAASRHARLRDVCEWACRFFEKSLRAPDGEAARAYFKRRGITGETALRFRLGWAPPGWRNLLDAARRASPPIAESDLVEVGLVRRKDADDAGAERVFDMFRGRVVFPIADAQGRVVAFGARTLGDDQPKYLNSPETPLFSKGRTVYALHLAKQEMMRTGEGAVMEGYTDVVMAHQCGRKDAVAGLGTALTREQASQIARYVKRLYLVYDGDSAGRRAAEKNAPAFLSEEIDARVAFLPEGEDPCDLLVRAGLPALAERLCVETSVEAFDHVLAAAKRVPGEAQALDAAVRALVPVTHAARRTIYVKRVADAFLLPHEDVRARLADLAAKESASFHRSSSPERSSAADRSSSVDGSASQVAESSSEAPALARRAPPPAPSTESLLVEALLGMPSLVVEAAERLPRAAMTHPYCRELAERLVARAEETGAAPPVDAVLAAIDDPGLAAFAAELLSRGVGKNLERQGRDCMAKLAAQHEGRALREGLDAVADPSKERRALEPDEGEILRRWQEFHRRRAAGA